MPRQEDRLLGARATRSKRRRIHRLQSNPEGDFFTELGLDPQSNEELLVPKRTCALSWLSGLT